MHSFLSLTVAFVLLSQFAAADDWVRFSSVEGGYNVKFPGESIERVEVTLGGNKMIMRHHTDLESLVFVATMHNLLPKGLSNQQTFKQSLDDARNGGLANINGKLVSETDITVDNLPGRELVVTGYGVKIRMWVVLGKTKLFQQIVAGPLEANLKPIAKQFFDSFEVTNP